MDVNKKENKLSKFLMKKSLYNYIVVVFVISALICSIIFINIFFKKRYDVKSHPKNVFTGENGMFLTNVYPIFNDVLMVGDSYSEFLVDDAGEDLMAYALGGTNLPNLRGAFECAEKSDKKYVVIFLGPNDYAMGTGLPEFEAMVSYFIDVLKDSNHTVIWSSYLKSQYTDSFEKEYPDWPKIEEFDKVIQKCCKKYGAYYFDIWDINDYKNNSRDQLHFNKDFNIKYINKLYDLIYDIEVGKK